MFVKENPDRKKKMWSNLQETADLATFTEEIVIGKLHILTSAVIAWRSMVIVKQRGLTICSAKQWTGFYMIGTSGMKELEAYLGFCQIYSI